jgi:hypothetical protein
MKSPVGNPRLTFCVAQGAALACREVIVIEIGYVDFSIPRVRVCWEYTTKCFPCAITLLYM